jgi:hypothetical protein
VVVDGKPEALSPSLPYESKEVRIKTIADRNPIPANIIRLDVIFLLEIIGIVVLGVLFDSSVGVEGAGVYSVVGDEG